jgi:MraZ protein
VGESGEKWKDAGPPGVLQLIVKIAHMFLGQYQHTLDEKGRLTVPARFRELLDGGAFVTQGLDQCLVVMTSASFSQTMADLGAMNMADPNARLLRRVILSNAYPIEVDKSGRVLIPQQLREFAGLDGDAIVAGQGDYFEVWSPKTWHEQMKQIQDTQANYQRFAALNLGGKAAG